MRVKQIKQVRCLETREVNMIKFTIKEYTSMAKFGIISKHLLLSRVFVCVLAAALLAMSGHAGTVDVSDIREWMSESFQNQYDVGRLLAGDCQGYNVKPPIDWSCTNIQDRVICWQLHGFIMLDPVMRQCETSYDERCGRYLHDYVLDWVRANPVPLKGNDWAWHDDATARRAHRMSYLWRFLPKLWSEEESREIKKSLDAQAALLATDSFYKRRHNHGMYQDLALLCYALCVCDDDAARKMYIDKAVARSLEYFDYVFCRNGVHKEHSLLYGSDVSKAARCFAKIVESIDAGAASRYDAYYRGAKRFLSLCTMPNRKWPSIGDSAEVISSFGSKTASEVASVFTDGEAGGGYAIFRSSWNDPPDAATWILFLAATFSSAHKHSDDLSFILYHRGDLFVEAGKRDYNYANPITTYAYSGYAHNVLCVDDRDFPVNVRQNGFRSVPSRALKTRIVNSVTNAMVSSVTGIQERFPGIVQTRTISFDRIGRTVTIRDYMDTKKAFKASLLFHLAPGIKVETRGEAFEFLRDGVKVASITFSGDFDLPVKPRVLTDEGEPPYRTWIFGGELEPKCGSLIIVDAECRAGRNSVGSFIKLF